MNKPTLYNRDMARRRRLGIGPENRGQLKKIPLEESVAMRGVERAAREAILYSLFHFGVTPAERWRGEDRQITEDVKSARRARAAAKVARGAKI